MSPLERALLAIIASRSGCAELAYARRPESLAGGYWAEISAFSLAAAPRGFAGELILRRMPSSPRTRIEIAVHTAAYELGFPTPRVRAFGGADEALGRSFVIMDRAGGTTLDQVQGARERVGRIRVLPRLLAEAQVRLHALPVEPLVERLAKHGLAPADLSTGALLADLGAQIRALAKRDLTRAHEWLERTRPGERRLALCHCDVHPNNLLVAEDGTWTLIDWTNARLAEPELDVAFSAELLELAPLAVPRGLRRLVQLGLRSASRSFQLRYLASAPLDAERLAWYQALYRLQLLVRIEAARAALPDAPPFSSAHPWRLVEPFAAARLRAAMLR
ncbi:MAG TPA: phosphotransferase [Myxococcota bacterium]|nr:phosphotransferase [Myxococcota bacterium]